jgi:hypothetical protein
MRRTLLLVLVMTTMAACGEGRPSVSSGTSSPRSDGGATSTPLVDGGEEPDGGLGDGAADGGDVDPLACPPVEGEALPAAILCRPDTTWRSPVLVSLSDGDDALAAVSADERTVAWFHIGGPTPQLLVADRPDVGAAFGSPQAVSPAGGMFGSRAALSPDGLQLVVVSREQRQLVVLARTAHGDAFALAEEGSVEAVAFARLNAALAELPDDRGIDDPVWSKDGAEFLVSVTSLDGATIHVATRTGSDAFSAAAARNDCELASHGVGHSRRPTAMSADGLTLFYFDEARNRERAAFRAQRDAPFSVFVDLGERSAAQPNASCDALWSLRATPAGSSEIVRETR